MGSSLLTSICFDPPVFISKKNQKMDVYTVVYSIYIYIYIPSLVPLPSNGHHQDFTFLLRDPYPSHLLRLLLGRRKTQCIHYTLPKTLIINDNHHNSLGTAAHSQRSAYCAPARLSVKLYAPGTVETSAKEDGTPPKTNMESKNWWLADVSPFPRVYFQVPAVSFGVQ